MRAMLVRELERARERLAATVAPATVPDPVELFRAAFGEPDPWQVDALRSAAPRLAFNVTRQGGKSSAAATLGAHAALSEPAAPVLLLSPGLRQSQELFRKVLDCYRAAGRPVLPEAENKLTLELANGSRVLALPGTEQTVRGFSGVRLLVIDEAARVPDELYYAVRPMLAVSGGRLVTLSTPFGTRGWWYEAWRSDAPWRRFEVPAADCPRIPAAFLEEERRALPDWFYQAEYGCRFMDAVDAVFRMADIEAALSADVRPLFGGLSQSPSATEVA
jgi:hypothetical protein